MGYAIMRFQKLKTLGSIGKHIDRSYNGVIHVPGNVESISQVEKNIHWDTNTWEAYDQNAWINFCKNKPLSSRVDERIKEGYKLSKGIRKDAVKAIEFMLSSDTYTMQRIFSDEEMTQEWIRENKRFVQEYMGKENIVAMSLHLDETTPHLHICAVPITKDGRLSARDYVNGKKQLSELQTSYANVMMKFGMKRGVQGSSRHHEKSHDPEFKRELNTHER